MAVKAKKATARKSEASGGTTVVATSSQAPDPAQSPPRETAALAPGARRRYVPSTMYGVLHPSAERESDPDFPDAPEAWTRGRTETLAVADGIDLTDDVWEVIRVLQGCYKDEVSPRIRLLHDALEARFASKGGMKYLYGILPGGPIVQGCALAGLTPPPGARDLSFGSVA